MIKLKSTVKIKALPKSLENTPALLGKKGIVVEIDPYYKSYPMYSVNVGLHGVLVFGPGHIEIV